MDNFFDETIKKVVIDLSVKIIDILHAEYFNDTISFDAWLMFSSDTEFMYCYENVFNTYFSEYLTSDTIMVLSYYSQNFSHSIFTLFDIVKDINLINIYIPKFIYNQFINMDPGQLFFVQK